METEGCYNYPETNTSALCMPCVLLLQPGEGKQMYLIFWERGNRRGEAEERSTRREMEHGGGVTIVKGMEQDESRKHGMGEDRDGERCGGIIREKGGGE